MYESQRCGYLKCCGGSFFSEELLFYLCFKGQFRLISFAITVPLFAKTLESLFEYDKITKVQFLIKVAVTDTDRENGMSTSGI